MAIRRLRKVESGPCDRADRSSCGISFRPEHPEQGCRLMAKADFEPVVETMDENGYDRVFGKIRRMRTAEPYRFALKAKTLSRPSAMNLLLRMVIWVGRDSRTARRKSGPSAGRFRSRKPGLYHIRIHYFPMEGKSAAIEREFRINGEIPFTGAEIIVVRPDMG